MNEERPSKSARKRQAHAIRALADRLVDLGGDELRRVVDDPDILQAVLAAQTMPSRGAGRRQRQFVAKLLRQADTGAIEAALGQADAGAAAEQRRFHAAERLRDRLLSGEDAGETLAAAGLAASPALDEALVAWQAARGDAARKRAGRNVFRALHELLVARDAADGE